MAKSRKGKSKLENWLHRSNDINEAFQLLKDPVNAQDECLPETGVGLDMERALSPMFIQLASYGSRSSNVIFFNDSHIDFYERDYINESENYFRVEPSLKPVISSEDPGNNK